MFAQQAGGNGPQRGWIDGNYGELAWSAPWRRVHGKHYVRYPPRSRFTVKELAGVEKGVSVEGTFHVIGLPLQGGSRNVHHSSSFTVYQRTMVSDAWQMLRQSEDDVQEQHVAWRNFGPFTLWECPKGLGIVSETGETCFALVRYPDGVVFHQGPCSKGEALTWVQGLLTGERPASWNHLLQDDDEPAAVPVAHVEPESPLLMEAPKRRGPALKTLKLGGNG